MSTIKYRSKSISEDDLQTKNYAPHSKKLDQSNDEKRSTSDRYGHNVKLRDMLDQEEPILHKRKTTSTKGTKDTQDKKKETIKKHFSDTRPPLKNRGSEQLPKKKKKDKDLKHTSDDKLKTKSKDSVKPLEKKKENLIDQIFKIFQSYNNKKNKMSWLKKIRYMLLGSFEKNLLADQVFGHKKGKGIDRIVVGVSFLLLAATCIFAGIFVAQALIMGLGATFGVLAAIVGSSLIYAGAKIRKELDVASKNIEEDPTKYYNIRKVTEKLNKKESDEIRKPLYELAKAKAMTYKPKEGKKDMGVLSKFDQALGKFLIMHQEILKEITLNSGFKDRIVEAKHQSQIRGQTEFKEQVVK